MRAPRLTASTCRIQLSRSFGFAAASRLVAYLDALGVSDLYTSPLTRARSGSPHGYDVVDPTRLNTELGSSREFAALCRALRQRGMGLLLDIVPNHMAAHPENRWWMDVLRRGPASRHARIFDIRWKQPHTDRLQVVLPVLHADYEAELEAGALRLSWEEKEAWVRYGGLRLPLDPRTARDLAGNGGRDAARRVQAYAGRPGDRRSFERLHQILSRQHYRLTGWRRAGEEVNYRRFFNISDLICVRVEDPAVFEMTHRLYFDLIARGCVTGLRVDHVDGLADPSGYLARLRHRAGRRAGLVVEKILMAEETLPPRWPVEGTTGYDMLNHINEVLVDARAAAELDAVYHEATGDLARFEDVVYEKKKRIIDSHFRGELEALVWILVRLVPPGRDLGASDLERALIEVTACLPVYRTYVTDKGISPQDRSAIRGAVREASRRGRARRAALHALAGVLLPAGSVTTRHLEFLVRWQQFTGPVMAKGGEDTALYVYSRLLSLNEVGGNPESPGLSIEGFHRIVSARARRWPATMNATATHDTKRGEDVRARINVLSQLSREWGTRLRRWRRTNGPHKRLVRGTPVPDGREELQLYQMLLGAWPLRVEDVEPFRRRFASYLTKAAREAKVHTRWRRPVPEHEEALVSFMDAILRPSRGNEFLPEFLEFQETIAWHGALNGLTSALLKLAAPGVADLYQGCELWDLRLVDPDNRRPVNWDRRRRMLEEVRRAVAEDPQEAARRLLAGWRDGRIKMLLTWRAMGLRRSDPRLFVLGSYLPVKARGDTGRHVIAFARRHGRSWALAAGVRFSAILGLSSAPLDTRVWGGTTLVLPPGAPSVWIDVLTGRALETVPQRGGRAGIPASRLFSILPVALLRAGSLPSATSPRRTA